MWRSVIVSFLILALAHGACAALGDGADKIEEAYGTLVSRHLRDDGSVEILYQKEKYRYRVTFERGVSVEEEYSRVDGHKLSEKEVARFLKMNAGRALTSQRSAATLKVKMRKGN